MSWWISTSTGGIAHRQAATVVVKKVSTIARILGSGDVAAERYLVPGVGSSQWRGGRPGKEAEKTRRYVVTPESPWQLAFVVKGVMRRGDSGKGAYDTFLYYYIP